MKQILNHNIANRYTISIVAVLIVAAAMYFAFTVTRDTTEAATSQKIASTKHAEPQLSFIGALGWQQGPTNETSMALFQDGHDCFASVEYKAGTVDVAAELEKIQASKTEMDLTSTPVDIAAVTLQSSEGQKHQYQLYQYSVSGSVGGQEVKGGQEFGYLKLTSGYLEIEGYCDTADKLPTTMPALHAIKFVASN